MATVINNKHNVDKHICQPYLYEFICIVFIVEKWITEVFACFEDCAVWMLVFCVGCCGYCLAEGLSVYIEVGFHA
jgi:hypothetical protein